MSTVGPTTTAGQSSALPKGTRLGEFEIRRVIGAGGFGIVYMAFDHGLEREVAIKEYMPSSLASRTATLHVSLTSPSNEETFKLGLRSFVNEAKLLARFDHRSLIKVHRFWEERGTAYMVMPLLRGRTLREVRRLMEQQPTEPWLRAVLDPVLGALEVLHREDVYHRDIAPDNILIGDDGVPTLLDFGAARHVIQGRSQTLTAILKPSYAPIEQYGESANLRQGAWTDLYALGATLHYLITESPPAPATVRTVTDEIPPLAALPRPGISEEFLRIVDWMLAPRPLDRPQSVAELREVLAGRRAIPVRPSPEPSATAWQRTELYRPPSARPGPAPTAAAPVPAGMPPRPVSPPAHQEPLPMPVPQQPAAAGRGAPPPRYEPTMRVDPPQPPGPARSSAAAEPLDFVASRPMPAHAAAPAPRAAAAPGAPRGVLPYAVGGGAVALVGAALWWMLRTPVPVVPAPAPPPAAASAAAAPASVVAPAIEPPASAVAAAASATAPSQAIAVPPAVVPGAMPAPAPPPARAPAPAPVAATPAPAPVTARVPTAAPAPAPRAAPTSVTPANDSGALRPLPPQRAPAPAPAPVRAEPTLPPPAPAPAARTADPAPSPAPAAPAQATARDPREACGRRMLIALHLCLVRECAKPAYHDHPECVEVRAIEERARNRHTQ